MRFDEAIRILRIFTESLASDGRIFLSASGIASELGNGYVNRDTPLIERFGCLSKEMSAKHHIHEPVCLYSEDDLASLGKAIGWKPVEIYSSEFGNVKAIFTLG